MVWCALRDGDAWMLRVFNVPTYGRRSWDGDVAERTNAVQNFDAALDAERPEGCWALSTGRCGKRMTWWSMSRPTVREPFGLKPFGFVKPAPDALVRKSNFSKAQGFVKPALGRLTLSSNDRCRPTWDIVPSTSLDYVHCSPANVSPELYRPRHWRTLKWRRGLHASLSRYT